MKKFVALMLALVLVFALSACGSDSKPAAPAAKDVNLSDVFAAFGLSGDELLTLTSDDLLEYYGIEAGDVKQFAAAQSLNSGSTEVMEIVLIEASSADAAAAVKSHLDDRYASICNQMKDYNADLYAILEKCSVRVDGNFVAMILTDKAEEYTKAYEAAIK